MNHPPPTDAPINNAVLATLAQLDEAGRTAFWYAETPEARLVATELMR